MSFQGQEAARRALRAPARVPAWCRGRSDPGILFPARRPRTGKIHVICLTARGVGACTQISAIERAGGSTQAPLPAEGKWPGWMTGNSAWTC
jgi:hypothetical protein